MKKQLIVITGPTCGGKTTFKESLMGSQGDAYIEIVTTTTRQRRPGERDGVAYCFRSKTCFEGMVESGDFIEWDRYDGNYYGIECESLNRFQDSGKVGVVVTTDRGVEALEDWSAKNGVTLVRVLATAPGDELMRRLSARPDVNREATQRRRERLLSELAKPVDLSKYDWIIEAGRAHA